jgi:hypothetical protein
MLSKVATKMEYIQKVFLEVQAYMQDDHELQEAVKHLDAEPPEYRSVSYESASMEIALKELSGGLELNQWKKFYLGAGNSHTFHMDIGLGWAFAKAEISPALYKDSLQLPVPWMVYDGIGYYYGLFRGRRTVRNKEVPDFLNSGSVHGFDQGLGRRLWYICKGDMDQLATLLHGFQASRKADLWRGIGIACAYVGGLEKDSLERLAHLSAEYKSCLSTGIALAAISRFASGSISPDIENACLEVCGLPLKDTISPENPIWEQFDSGSGNISRYLINLKMKDQQ